MKYIKAWKWIIQHHILILEIHIQSFLQSILRMYVQKSLANAFASLKKTFRKSNNFLKAEEKEYLIETDEAVIETTTKKVRSEQTMRPSVKVMSCWGKFRDLGLDEHGNAHYEFTRLTSMSMGMVSVSCMGSFHRSFQCNLQDLGLDVPGRQRYKVLDIKFNSDIEKRIRFREITFWDTSFRCIFKERGPKKNGVSKYRVVLQDWKRS